MKTFENIIKILIVALCIALTSCEEKIDLSVENRDVRFLVVEGQISSDTTAHEVVLSYSGDFYMDTPTGRATGAHVRILDDEGNVFALQESEAGVYHTHPDVYGVPGRKYTLVIEHDQEVYEATSIMPRAVEMDSLAYRYDPYLERYRVLLYGQEPEGKGDNYMWHIWKNGELTTDRTSTLLLTADELFDGRYIMGFEVDWFSNEHEIEKGDTVKVGQHSITLEAIDFKWRVMDQSNGGMSMGSPANIPSNISNGAKGLFHATSVTYKTIVLE